MDPKHTCETEKSPAIRGKGIEEDAESRALLQRKGHPDAGVVALVPDALGGDDVELPLAGIDGLLLARSSASL
jgi:hypothetical protein